MRRRAQPHDLRTEIHPAVVKIMCFMIQRNVNRHKSLWCFEVRLTTRGGSRKEIEFRSILAAI